MTGAHREAAAAPGPARGQGTVAACVAGLAASCMFVAVSANAILYVVLQHYLVAQWGKGLVIAAYFVPTIVGNRIYAALARRRSPATLAGGAALISSAMFLLQSVAVQSWETMLATRATLGLCVGVFVPAIMFLGRQALAERAESAFGLFSLSIPLASLVGPGMAEFVFDQAGPVRLFVLLAAFALGSAGMLFSGRPLLRPRPSGAAASTPSRASAPPAAELRREAWLLFAGSTSFGVSTNLVGVFIAPKVIGQHLGVAVFFCFAIFMLVGVRLAMMWPRFPRLGAGSVWWLSFGLVASTALAFAPLMAPLVLAGAMGFGLFQALLFPKLVYLGHRAAGSGSQRHIGNLNLVIAVCGFCVALVVGLLADRFGISLPGTTLCGLQLLVLLAARFSLPAFRSPSMKHLVVVDANLATLQTLRAAKARGHRVTFIRCLTFSAMPDNDEAREVLTMLDEIVDMPATDDADALCKVGVAIAARHPVDGVLTQMEFSTEATAALVEQLDVPGTSLRGVRNARRKAVARQLLEDAGVPSARFGLASELDEAVRIARRIGLPVVVKPASGADSMYAAVATNDDEVRQATRAILQAPEHLPLQLKAQFSRGALIEERLVGPLVSAELGAIDGSFTHFGISGRVRGASDETIELGSCTPSRLSEVECASCRVYAEEVCRTLGLDFGIFHIEMIMTERGPILVEANPRLMGGIMPRVYELATGMKMSEQLLSMALERSFLPWPQVQRCATSRKVQAAGGGRIAPSLDLGGLMTWGHTLDHFSMTSLLQPGREVERGEILARIVVTGADNDDADARAAEALDAAERFLSVSLER